VGAVFLPVVIGYQSWSYWVFRRRVTRVLPGPVS
jgi:cytochrome bd ubiquinol oxidase subunit II